MLYLLNPGFMFGYAKPVPVNFGALRNPKQDMVWVAAAGPAMNILLATISAILLWGSIHAGLDAFVDQLFFASIQVNLILAIFNMIPIPPLDGGRVAVGLLPMPLALYWAQLGRFGLLPLLLILIVLPYFGISIFDKIVAPPVEFVERWILTLMGLQGG
jgi:Zn-dependent protease